MYADAMFAMYLYMYTYYDPTGVIPAVEYDRSSIG